jgi:hypothetical protein
MKIFNKIRELFTRVSPWAEIKETRRLTKLMMRALVEMRQNQLWKDWKSGKISDEEFHDGIAETYKEASDIEKHENLL